ncbi:hypothetical protein BGW38_009301 [Lunasporangiospora selenospora]|uniref:Uncharacterized protein n=1 Tax=Lunasporangiospora selenospora TaxID=979761 RepID=A0A9P6FXE4_9FUNG|nr:hypothetical protein BGW38_009301 [Lunasporangiospora selenospora]
MATRVMPRPMDNNNTGPSPRLSVAYLGDYDVLSQGEARLPLQTNPNRLSHSSVMSTPQATPRLRRYDARPKHSGNGTVEVPRNSVGSLASLLSSNSISQPNKVVLQEIDNDLSRIAELLADVVLTPPGTTVEPSLFQTMGCLELYDEDQQSCKIGLREERRRLLERRQALEVEMVRHDIAGINLKIEESRRKTQQSSQASAGALPHPSKPYGQQIQELNEKLESIRKLIEMLHQGATYPKSASELEETNSDVTKSGEEEEEEEMSEKEPRGLNRLQTFRELGLLYVYDDKPDRCLDLCRSEHARLASKLDALELELERQRTLLLAVSRPLDLSDSS